MFGVACGVCDFKNQLFLDYSQAKRKIIFEINTPGEIKRFYEMIKDYQYFLPLFSLGNILYCIANNDDTNPIFLRDMNFEIVSQNHLNEIETLSYEIIKDHVDKISYFESSFVLGSFIYPTF